MLNEARELLEKYPDLYRSFDDPIEEPDIIRSYDANSLMGIYLAVFDLFVDLVKTKNESRAKELLSYAKVKLYADKPNWPSELSTAIILGFFENFGHEKELWQNLNRWFSKDEYYEFKEAFEHLLEPNEKIKLQKLFK